MTKTWREDKWNALTDDDLQEIAGKKDRLVGKLQERYGYGEEQAQREAAELLRLHPEVNGGPGPQTTETAQAPALPPPTHLESPSPAALATQAPPALVRPSADPAYTHSATVWISPRVLRWVAPVAAVALFVLLFLPWTGAYPGGYRVYTQNAFQAIWGGVSVGPAAAEALDFVKPFDEVVANRLMLPYTLLVLLALALALAPLWLSPSRVQALPPIVQPLWRWRLELLGAVALAAFVLLIVQLWTGFGLEAAFAARADNNLAGEFAAASTPAELDKVKIHQGLAVGRFSLGRTLWLRLAVCGHVLLLTGLGLELWLVWRGSRPLPRIDGRA